MVVSMLCVPPRVCLECRVGKETMTFESAASENRIEINPHLEPYGHHAVEWSYHFPLKGIDAVEASLTIVVPSEKAPSLSRESLLNSLIAHTRFSLANAARSAVELSKTFYDDSLWIKNQLCRSSSDFCGVSDLENSPVLLRCMRDDFSMGFLSKLTLILQSHLKRSARCLVRSVRNLEYLGHTTESVAECSSCFVNFEQALRSAENVVDATLIWRGFREQVRNHPHRTEASKNSHLEKLCAELEEISELVIVLMGKHIADGQDAFFRVLDRTSSMEQFQACTEFARQKLGVLSGWTQNIHSWRSQMGLVDLSTLANDYELAARYFERSLELKRSHYRKWDLSVHLRKSLNSRARKVFFSSKGVLEGVCRFDPPEFKTPAERADKDSLTVLEIERRIDWEKRGQEWCFQLSETFRPVQGDAKVPTNAVKQLWRIPFDNILDSLDDSVHVLKLPALENRPQHLKTHKRMSFPFEIQIRTMRGDGKKVVPLELCSIQGHIVVFGAQIVSVELSRGS